MTTFKPLPSFELLEMQWFLNRIVFMSAVGERDDDDNFNDDDDDGDDSVLLQPGCLLSENVSNWVPPPPSIASASDDNGFHETGRKYVGCINTLWYKLKSQKCSRATALAEVAHIIPYQSHWRCFSIKEKLKLYV